MNRKIKPIKVIKSSRQQNCLGNIILILAIFLVIGLYWRWALPGVITYGDWWHETKIKLLDYSLSLWSAGGFGSYNILAIPVLPIQVFSGFLYRILHIDPALIQRVVFFIPLLLFFIISPWYLAHTLGYRKIGIAATIVVSNLNSIIFLTVAITNMALAMALSELAIAFFIQVFRCTDFRYKFLTSLVIAIQTSLDARIAYVTALFCGVYFIYHITISSVNSLNSLLKICRTLFIVILIFLLLQSYWLIPFSSSKLSNPTMVSYPDAYDNTGWVRTLSYWSLLHSLSLQSPWWGQSGIVNPIHLQFLLLPIFVFCGFLVSIHKRKQILLFFGFSALIFSFLAKGSKPPFGEVYLWLFQHVPGFSMFREPGKWWFPVVNSYAVLVGGFVDYLTTRKNFTQFLDRIKRKFNIPLHIFKIGFVCLVAGLLFTLFPVQPISTLHYSANFVPRQIPEESMHLELFLHSQPNFFRILWLPTAYRFGYSSTQHPGLSGIYERGVLTAVGAANSKEDLGSFSYLGQSFSILLLSFLSVKYIIVPYAPQNEPDIYYWYQSPQYYRQIAEKTPGLKPISFNGKSHLYEVPAPLPHIYIVRHNSAEDVSNRFD